MPGTTLEWLSLAVGVVGFGFPGYQLYKANNSLQASNTIALSAEARSVAEKIRGAGTDECRLYDASHHHYRRLSRARSSGNVAHLTLAVLRFEPSATPQGSHCVVPAS